MLGLFVFLALKPEGRSFVLMGPVYMPFSDSYPRGVMPEFAQLGYYDHWGSPKELRHSFRWNIPDFTYSFDASFVNYFGPDGMEAVHDAINVINDFFDNEEYSGVSELDLHKHGFAGNYNTTWINTTAHNQQILDVKSMVLGSMVNFLGLGNPHRNMFNITGLTNNANLDPTSPFPGNWKFRVALRNYDPLTQTRTNRVNGVDYSYRLIHNWKQGDRLWTPVRPGGGAGFPRLPPETHMEMEEFTTDISGNAWSSVAAINSAFYGGSRLEPDSRLQPGLYPY